MQTSGRSDPRTTWLAAECLFQRTVFSLCSIGAIVVAFGLALDPSIQQLVSYPLRPANISFEATTRRANLSIMVTPGAKEYSTLGSMASQFQRAPYLPNREIARGSLSTPYGLVRKV